MAVKRVRKVGSDFTGFNLADYKVATSESEHGIADSFYFGELSRYYVVLNNPRRIPGIDDAEMLASATVFIYDAEASASVKWNDASALIWQGTIADFDAKFAELTAS